MPETVFLARRRGRLGPRAAWFACSMCPYGMWCIFLCFHAAWKTCTRANVEPLHEGLREARRIAAPLSLMPLQDVPKHT